jgi:Mg2+ and Co2+ transporter CorA
LNAPKYDGKSLGTSESEFMTSEMLFKKEYGDAVREIGVVQDGLQMQYTSLNIQETQRSIKLSEMGLREAKAVGRLTQLTFLFLPLTFTTGIFGMNIKPFHEGAPMWQFWTTTLCILVPFWVLGIGLG